MDIKNSPGFNPEQTRISIDTNDPELSILNSFDIRIRDDKDKTGFRIIVLDGGEVAATHNFTEVTKLDDFPLKESDGVFTNIKVFIGNLATVEKFKGKGIGLALWKLSTKTLLERNKLPLIQVVEDDSVGGWTKRHHPDVVSYIEKIGFKADKIWAGILDEKDSWIIRYDSNKPSHLLSNDESTTLVAEQAH